MQYRGLSHLRADAVILGISSVLHQRKLRKPNTIAMITVKICQVILVLIIFQLFGIWNVVSANSHYFQFVILVSVPTELRTEIKITVH